tara:strand:- start:85 stop:336 length:252 start_codon:yes stop_codon:yes gene_type:complete
MQTFKELFNLRSPLKQTKDKPEPKVLGHSVGTSDEETTRLNATAEKIKNKKKKPKKKTDTTGVITKCPEGKELVNTFAGTRCV